MKRGDIILLGESRSLYSAVIKEPFTHTAIYLGLGGFISASINGVKISPYRKLFGGVENIIILRMRKDFAPRQRVIRSVIHFAKSKIGSPYNFDFVKSNKYFFCSQLINEAFLNAGYPTGLDSFDRKKESRAISRFFHSKASAALHPEDLVKGNFDIVFVSKHLKVGKDGNVYRV